MKEKEQNGKIPHIFLTGEKQVGKSTLLRKLRRELCERYHLTEVGFETRPYEINGSFKGFYLHGLIVPEHFANDCPINISLGAEKRLFVTECFELPGVEILKNSRKLARQKPVLLVLDELGKAEGDALEFQSQICRCLDEMEFAVGVLQKGDMQFPQSIAARTDAAVYTVTKENRDTLLDVIIKDLEHFKGFGT